MSYIIAWAYTLEIFKSRYYRFFKIIIFLFLRWIHRRSKLLFLKQVFLILRIGTVCTCAGLELSSFTKGTFRQILSFLRYFQIIIWFIFWVVIIFRRVKVLIIMRFLNSSCHFFQKIKSFFWLIIIIIFDRIWIIRRLKYHRL